MSLADKHYDVPSPILLRALAAAGLLAWCRDDEWRVGGARPDSEPFYVAVAMVAGLVVAQMFARAGARLVLRHLDLLVPAGCLMLANALLELLPIPAASIDFGDPFAVFRASLPSLGLLVVTIVFAAYYVAWQTLAVVQVVSTNTLDLFETLRRARGCIPRALLVGTLAYAGLFAPISLAIWGGLAQEMLILLIIAFAVWGVVWGLLTCLWLPLGLDRDRPWGGALRNAIDTALRKRGRLLPVLVPWMLALGLLTLHHFSIDRPGESSTSSNWNVSPQWYGAYPSNCYWYTKLTASAEVPQHALYSLPLTLLFVFVAIAVKAELLLRLDRGTAVAEPAAATA